MDPKIEQHDVEEFVHNAVWRDLRNTLRERRTALYANVLEKYSDLPEVIEIKLINDILTHVQGVKEEIKEDLK